MRLAQSILSFLKADDNTKQAPEGLCPNCWGRQEYGGQFYNAVKNRGLDVNKPDEHLGWVQQYADQHFGPVKLQAHENYQLCESCKVKFEAA